MRGCANTIQPGDIFIQKRGYPDKPAASIRDTHLKKHSVKFKEIDS